MKSKISQIGSSKLRHALYFSAMSSMRSSPNMIKFAQKLRSKGKNGKVIACLVPTGKVFMVNAGWKNSLDDTVTRIMKNHIET